MIFALAVAIFALVAGAIGKDEYTKMCYKNYTGIITIQSQKDWY